MQGKPFNFWFNSRCIQPVLVLRVKGGICVRTERRKQIGNRNRGFLMMKGVTRMKKGKLIAAIAAACMAFAFAPLA